MFEYYEETPALKFAKKWANFGEIDIILQLAMRNLNHVLEAIFRQLDPHSISQCEQVRLLNVKIIKPILLSMTKG